MNSTQHSHLLKASLLQYYHIYPTNTPKEKEHIKKEISLILKILTWAYLPSLCCQIVYGFQLYEMNADRIPDLHWF